MLIKNISTIGAMLFSNRFIYKIKSLLTIPYKKSRLIVQSHNNLQKTSLLT